MSRTRGSNSQHDQDLFVIEVLDGMRGGFFLDSGAADGLIMSNTLVLEESFGWSGICIEPNKEFFATLLQNRRCLCVNCCLYDREGMVDFVENARGLGGILEEYSEPHLQFAKQTFELTEDARGRPGTVQKVCRTAKSILRECGAPPVIDYWSLDTEGSELAILKSFPFEDYRVKVLTVEHNWSPARHEIRNFLEGRGYRLARSLEIDDGYVLNGQAPG
jgi:FkbM family methyltransferase